jgi:hypothetical protein
MKEPMENDHTHTLTEAVAVANEPKKDEYTRGPNGTLGTPTAALSIRQLWHQTHFTQVDAGDRRNPHRKAWQINPASHPVSLKRFARNLLVKKDAVAIDWFANKNGAQNAKRTDANIKAAHEAASATKLGRKKTKGGGGAAK